MFNTLQKAMIRLAYAEKKARSALTSGDDVRQALLELHEAARCARKTYLNILQSQVEDLATQPVINGGQK